VASVEDLFEVQRKELYSSMAEQEKHFNKKMDNVSRAIHELARELKVQNPLILM